MKFVLRESYKEVGDADSLTRLDITWLDLGGHGIAIISSRNKQQRLVQFNQEDLDSVKRFNSSDTIYHEEMYKLIKELTEFDFSKPDNTAITDRISMLDMLMLEFKSKGWATCICGGKPKYHETSHVSGHNERTYTHWISCSCGRVTSRHDTYFRSGIYLSNCEWSKLQNGPDIQLLKKFDSEFAKLERENNSCHSGHADANVVIRELQNLRRAMNDVIVHRRDVKSDFSFDDVIL